MSLCNIWIKSIKEDLAINNSVDTLTFQKSNSVRFMTVDHILSIISSSISADTTKCVCNTPTELILLLFNTENNKTAFYNDTIEQAHYETKVLYKLGFIDLTDSYLVLNKELVQVLNLVTKRKELQKEIYNYLTTINKIIENKPCN